MERIIIRQYKAETKSKEDYYTGVGSPVIQTAEKAWHFPSTVRPLLGVKAITVPMSVDC
jgi:hypothetical protein